MRASKSPPGANDTQPENEAGLVHKIGLTLCGIAQFGRRHRALFLGGTMASIGVVAVRLALPWPLRSVVTAVSDADLSSGVGDVLSREVVQLAVLFLCLVTVLGLLDYLARLYFSRFAIATTRDMRQTVFTSTLGISPESRKVASGDLVSRLIGDAARLKAGLQGFLLHVATNGLLFVGVTVILWTIDPRMGMFFTLGALLTGLLTIWGALGIFRLALQHRHKEGKLANKIYSSLTKPATKAKLKRINKSSGRYEASLTRQQGRITWAAHFIFGFAVLGSLWSGVQAVAAETMTLSDLLLFMFYVLMLRGPVTRLARQGTRTGKILGPAYRLVQMLQPQVESSSTLPALRLRSLKRALLLKNVDVSTPTGSDCQEQGMVRLDMTVKRGECVAVVDRSGVSSAALLEIVAGQRGVGNGSLTWDSAELRGQNRRALHNQVALIRFRPLTSECESPLAERFCEIAIAARRRASLQCYLEPDEGLSPSDAARVMESLSEKTRGTVSATLVATRHQHGLENFDRIVHVENGHVIFDGSFADWRGKGRATAETTIQIQVPMTRKGTTMKILFAGYAPVHFRCFQPLYERLRNWPGVEVYVSGGLRTKKANGYDYDTESMYAGFDLPPETTLSVEAIRDMEFDVQFSAHTKLILPKRVEKRIQIFHGVSFRNKAVRPENMGCDHYFVIGPYMLRRFTEAGLLGEDESRIAKIGFMKTDALVDGSLQKDVLLQSVGFDGSRPVILYAPTGAKRNSLETMGEDVIRKLLAVDKYDVLIKPHDHPKNKDIDWATHLRRYESEHCHIVEPREDVIPMLVIADLLISDASSVVNEFAMLDRPILYLDTPDLLDQARDARYSMLDMDTWGRSGGLVAERADVVPALVEESLAEPKHLSLVRRRIADDLFFNHGKATAAAMEWLGKNVLPVRGTTEELNNEHTAS